MLNQHDVITSHSEPSIAKTVEPIPFVVNADLRAEFLKSACLDAGLRTYEHSALNGGCNINGTCVR
jgi:hypothetical protein